VTPEQRQVVQQILAAKGFYDVLGVPKDASEADIKQAYRKVRARSCCRVGFLCMHVNMPLPAGRREASAGRVVVASCLWRPHI
jgi:hypothetical protein